MLSSEACMLYLYNAERIWGAQKIFCRSWEVVKIGLSFTPRSEWESLWLEEGRGEPGCRPGGERPGHLREGALSSLARCSRGLAGQAVHNNDHLSSNQQGRVIGDQVTPALNSLFSPRPCRQNHTMPDTQIIFKGMFWMTKERETLPQWVFIMDTFLPNYLKLLCLIWYTNTKSLLINTNWPT